MIEHPLLVCLACTWESYPGIQFFSTFLLLICIFCRYLCRKMIASKSHTSLTTIQSSGTKKQWPEFSNERGTPDISANRSCAINSREHQRLLVLIDLSRCNRQYNRQVSTESISLICIFFVSTFYGNCFIHIDFPSCLIALIYILWIALCRSSILLSNSSCFQSLALFLARAKLFCGVVLRMIWFKIIVILAHTPSCWTKECPRVGIQHEDQKILF